MEFNTISRKLILVSTFLFFTIYSCKTNKPTIVGVWKPSKLILSKELKKDQNRAMFINMSFEKSKEIYYQFNPDGTFEFISDKVIPGMENAKGTYTIKESYLTIKYNSTTQESEIIKLTNTEMQGQSKDSIIVVYEKLNQD